MRIVFRRAEEKDSGDIVGLLAQLHDGANFSDMASFSYEDTAESVLSWVNNEAVDIILADCAGVVIGLIVVVYQRPYFNYDCLLAYGLTIWVTPEYRKYNIGRRLYKRGIQLAKGRGADIADVGVRLDNPALVKFHKRYGATEHETILRHRLK
jgi:ribosomal protein S18 acetylase RimI-like enzyme